MRVVISWTALVDDLHSSMAGKTIMKMSNGKDPVLIFSWRNPGRKEHSTR